jgi:hypothetical protein
MPTGLLRPEANTRVAPRAGQGPFRYAGAGAFVDEVLLVSVMDIGEPLEASGQGRAHILLPLTSRTPGVASPGHLQHAVIGEEAHDAIEIVRVEGVTKPLQILADVRHRSPSPQLGAATTLSPA